MNGVPWFSQDLTTLVHPMVAGRVYVVLAPTGTGKTLFGLNVVAQLLQDWTAIQVLVAATEETPRYYELLACRAAGVSYADFFYERLNELDVQSVARWLLHYRGSMQLQMVAQREPTLTDLLNGVVPHRPPHLLVIDHLHGFQSGRTSLPAFLDLAMNTLTHLATSLDTCILLLAQVHRPQGRDPLYAYRIPTATSGLGSAKIEQSADVLLGVSRKLRDDLGADVLARLAKGLLKRGESVRDYEEPNTARVTVLKHRMDDAACRRSLLLTVNGGKMQDRLALVDYPPGNAGDAWVAGER